MKKKEYHEDQILNPALPPPYSKLEELMTSMSGPFLLASCCWSLAMLRSSGHLASPPPPPSGRLPVERHHHRGGGGAALGWEKESAPTHPKSNSKQRL